MGLDISVRTRLVFVRRRENKEDSPREYENGDWICQQNPKCFQRQVADLEPGFYKADRDMGFAAGSYSGYNDWRKQLAQQMFGVDTVYLATHTAEFENKPFFELIYFSDCEGLIGPAACARLANDFDTHMRSFTAGGWWYEKAQQWARACRIAAGNHGVLRFG